jgi:thioredoxin 1
MASDAVLELTDDNFDTEVIKSPTPVLVDFWAEWCMPCRMLGPTIDDLANEFKGKVKVGKVDVDANRNVAMQLNITAIPTVILFKGGQVLKKFVGVTPKGELSGALAKASE